MMQKPEHLRDLAQTEALLCVIDPIRIHSCGGPGDSSTEDGRVRAVER